MTTPIPYFKSDAPAPRDSWDEAWKLFNTNLTCTEFEEYAKEYFSNGITLDKSTELQCFERALKHNIENLETPLNTSQSSDLLQIVNHLRKKYTPDNFTGIWWRLIWENSEQNNEIKTSVKTMMNNCFGYSDIRQFLSYKKGNYDTIETFYGSDPNGLFDIYCSGTIDKYLTAYIYSSNFIERYSELSNPGRYINRAYNFVQRISEFMQEVLIADKDRLEFFVSVLYAVDKQLNNDPKPIKEQKLVEFKEMLHKLMKSNYPAEYQEFQTMLSLGIDFKPKDIIAQICCGSELGGLDSDTNQNLCVW